MKISEKNDMKFPVVEAFFRKVVPSQHLALLKNNSTVGVWYNFQTSLFF